MSALAFFARRCQTHGLLKPKKDQGFKKKIKKRRGPKPSLLFPHWQCPSIHPWSRATTAPACGTGFRRVPTPPARPGPGPSQAGRLVARILDKVTPAPVCARAQRDLAWGGGGGNWPSWLPGTSPNHFTFTFCINSFAVPTSNPLTVYSNSSICAGKFLLELNSKTLIPPVYCFPSTQPSTATSQPLQTHPNPYRKPKLRRHPTNSSQGLH
ncbi:hypothetical protein IF1G_09451 [Cordyceps javanica]|uniref:Uncharacterized protein n=1 Tax=Cordyceps javanica TaxID=43265 RepID=A0A545UQY0_9HYPO|nr:hypothetical protein IF1G_09451 [Cordyceps javanica]